MKKIIFIILFLSLFGCGKKIQSLSYELKNDGTYKVSLNNESKDKKIEIPSKYEKKNVTEIDEFRVNSFVEEIVIPSTINNISSTSFEKCENLVEINVDGKNKMYASIDGNLYSKDKRTLIKYACGKKDDIVELEVGIISTRAFYNATNITKLSLMKTTKINTQAFMLCENLETVNLGSDLEKIGNAFGYCHKLKSINISLANAIYKSLNGSIYSKDGRTLYQCPTGKEGTFTISCEEVRDYAFQTSLVETIILKDSVNSIGKEAFDECNNISKIYIDSNYVSNTFTNEMSYLSGINLYVKKGNSVSQYIIENYTKKTTVIYEEVEYDYYEVK